MLLLILQVLNKIPTTKRKTKICDQDRLDLMHPTVKPIKNDLFETYARFMIRFCRDVPFKLNTVCERNQWVYQNHQFSIDYHFGYDSRIRDIEYI